MTYKVIVRQRAEKERCKLPAKDQDRILAAFCSLETDPFRGKKLHGDLDGAWAIRIWPYRIVYTIEKKIITVTVLRIGHRKNVFQ